MTAAEIANVRALPSVKSPRLSKLIVPALLLLHVSITLPLAALVNLWIDETFSLETTRHSFTHAITRGIHFELQPPMYFALLNLWRSFGASVFVARLFSVVCVALMLLVVALISRRYFRDQHPGWLVGAVALNPFVIWAAVEIRVYALALLLSSLLILFFHDGWWSEENEKRNRARLGYALVALLGLYTHYYLGFLLVAHAGALLWRRNGRLLMGCLASMMAVGVAFLPLAMVVRAQLTGHTQTLSVRHSLVADARLLWWHAQEYLLPAYWKASAGLQRAMIGLLALAVLFLLLRRFRDLVTTDHLALWTMTAIAGLFFIVALKLTGPMLMETRHMVALFLPLQLSLFAVLTTIGGRRVLTGWSALLLFFYVSSLLVVWHPLAKVGDWQRVAAWLQREEKPGEPVAVFNIAGALSLQHYYHGVNPTIQLPRETPLDEFDTRDYVFRNETEIAGALRKAQNAAGRLWLITDPDKDCKSMDVDLNCRGLEDYLAAHYVTAKEQFFFHSRIRLLQAATSGTGDK